MILPGPVVFLGGLGIAYHCFNTLEDLPVFLVLAVHIETFLVLLCWGRCCFTGPGRVPTEFGEDAAFLACSARGDDGELRYCKACKRYKPDRAYHCASCKTCILKQQLHFEWADNCIGFNNYKYFVLLLFYTAIFSITILVTLIWSFLVALDEDEEHVVPVNFHLIECSLACFVTMCFAGLSLSFFCIHFFKLVARNMSWVEFVQRHHKKSAVPSYNPYDLGTFFNFLEVFGENAYYWFLPINGGHAVGDGLAFQITEVVVRALESS